MANYEEMVKAVRADSRIGRGTCAVIDECWEDSELVDHFKNRGCETPEQAVAEMHEIEGLNRERALNQREGNDNDWQLAWYREWEEGNE